ncbi:hypothetical protein LTR62_001149 [Meristemomyces frigidus]|uniref:AD domain-containing protein n=1 Tax=Meristemomyces frigidus TaxID=1508187 RepID=A0AAN7TM12_9PEZI|nr:hypothetical protein LTR62_001149 [Meristemomyces frigidus]
MADTKRNNTIAGKVAMPKTTDGAQAALPDTHEAIAKAIGARIKLTTVAPQSQIYEGTIYTTDPITNLVVLDTRLASSSTDPAKVKEQPSDFKFFTIARIQHFQIVALASGDHTSESDVASARPAISAVNLARLEKRCEDKVRELKEQERNRGRGVSKEGQAIFDAFKRINVRVHWHNTQIIAADAVIIKAPYRVEDCVGTKDKQEALIRIKKVLEGERRKIREREERERKDGTGTGASTPTGPRKGG